MKLKCKLVLFRNALALQVYHMEPGLFGRAITRDGMTVSAPAYGGLALSSTGISLPGSEALVKANTVIMRTFTDKAARNAYRDKLLAALTAFATCPGEAAEDVEDYTRDPDGADSIILEV